MARGQQGPPTDWVTRAADDALRHAREGETITCSSGASARPGRSTWATCASS